MDEAVEAGAAVLAAVDAAVARCHALASASDVGSRLALTRALADLLPAVQVAQARVLAGLDVHEAADFGSRAIPGPLGEPGTVPGPDAVTPHEVAAHLGVSADAARTTLAVASTLIGSMPAVAAATEAGQLRWWQTRRVVDAAWALPDVFTPALDARVAELAGQGRLGSRFSPQLGRLVMALDPDLAERSLTQALADREVRIRPDQDSPGMGVVIATVPAEGAITVGACLDRLADTPLLTPPPGLAAAGRSADARRADALVGLTACVLDALADTAPDIGAAAAGGVDADIGARIGAAVRAAVRAAAPANADSATPVAPAGVAPPADPSCPAEPAESADPALVADPREPADVAEPADASEPADRADRADPAPAADPHEPADSADPVDRADLAPPANPAGPPDPAGPAMPVDPATPVPADLAGRRSRRVKRRSGQVRVTMSVETLLGLRDDPGDLAGWGPITAGHARRLATADGTVWQRILTDPLHGSVLDVGRTRYTPTAAIRAHVLARDGYRCRRPGCTNAASDLDHVRAFDDGGSTAVSNLQAVCRGCHTVKHQGWNLRRDRTGLTIWRTPHGLDTSQPLPDLRPEDRMPKPPPPPSTWRNDLEHDLRRAAAQQHRTATRDHDTPSLPPPPGPSAAEGTPEAPAADINTADADKVIETDDLDPPF